MQNPTLFESFQKYIFSDMEYLKWLFIAMFIDLVTGITKAWVVDGCCNITSKGLRMTVSKMTQYGSFLIITHVLSHFTVGGKEVSPLGFVENWALGFLLIIEVKSVYENLVAINPALEFVKPLLKKISLILKSDNGRNID